MNFQTTVSDSLAWVPTDLVFFFVSNRRSDKALPQALGRCFFFAGLTEEGHVMFVKSICIGLMSAVTLLYQQAASAEPAPSDVQVMLVEDGEAVHYRGGLDESAISRVEDLIKNADGRVKRLVIDSAGGEINLGMDLAGLVVKNGLDVVVDRLCASSCANYVFPAGKIKRITPNALVLWHGSAIQEGIEQVPATEDHPTFDGMALSPLEKRQVLESAREKYAQYISDTQARQEAFFKRLGVDARVTVMGQQLKVAQEWTLSPEDMAYFGIHNVTASADYGQTLPEYARERGVKWLRLVDYPNYLN